MVKSVLTYLSVPFVAGIFTRFSVTHVKGNEWFAAVIDPLIEVPLMILLVRLALYLKGKYFDLHGAPVNKKDL